MTADDFDDFHRELLELESEQSAPADLGDLAELRDWRRNLKVAVTNPFAIQQTIHLNQKAEESAPTPLPNETRKPCAYCAGKGFVYPYIAAGRNNTAAPIRCYYCSGKGYTVHCVEDAPKPPRPA